MQKNKERTVSFYDLVLSAHTHGKKLDLAPLPLINFFRQIELWHAAKQCPQWGRKSAETVYLADVKVNPSNTRVDLLINRSDRDASDTVYSDPNGNTVRRLPKVAGEGSDFSAHVVITLVPQRNIYKLVLEIAPGLPSGKIQYFLNFLIRHCINQNKMAYHVLHPNNSLTSAGVPVTVLAYHKVELTGHPSQDFLKSINGGVLESIELIDTRKNNLIWDSNGFTKEVSRTVNLRVGPKANALNFSRIKEAAGLAYKKKYSSARVRFKAPDGIMSTVTFDTQSTQLANDVIYVKKEKISGFSTLLESSYEKFNSEVINKMINLL